MPSSNLYFLLCEMDFPFFFIPNSRLLNSSPVDVQQLASQIKPLVQKSEGVVVLYASKQSNYGLVVQVMDVVKRAGGLRLALATQP